jgi:dihydrodipicolinate synthase/N-acetylneuraminate lyase
MKEIKAEGVVIPLITPFTSAGSIDEGGTDRLVEHVVSHDCHPFVLGTTGESLSIPMEDKLYFVKAASRANNGRKTCYAGISGMCFVESVNAGKIFADNGVDILVAHLPSYYPMSEESMQRYFVELADALPLPLMLYNIKATTHMSIPMDIIITLSEHENIIGLKDSERDEARLDAMLDLFRERKDFSYQLGWAARSTHALKGGADGIIPSTGNAFPQFYSRLFNAVRNGDLEEAEKYQSLTDELGSVYQKGKLLSQALPGLKIILEHLGICESHCLPPCYPLDIEESARIIEEVNQIREKSAK